METVGVFAPESEVAVREAYAAVGPAAREVVRETAKALGFDREEYRERVTGAVVETARDALFASLLEVHRGTREEFDEWCRTHPEFSVSEAGSPDVSRVVWHPAPATGTVVAATYEREPDAAASALRRQAFGRVYRDLLDTAGETGAEADASRDVDGDADVDADSEGEP
jgi:hypothetical protein